MKKLALTVLVLIELLLVGMIVAPAVNAECDKIGLKDVGITVADRFLLFSCEVENNFDKHISGLMFGFTYSNKNGDGTATDAFLKEVGVPPLGEESLSVIRPLPKDAATMSMQILMIFFEDGSLIKCFEFE